MADLEELKIKFKLEKLADSLGFVQGYDSTKYSKYMCPFHSDNDPSFVVNKISQTCHCFNDACIAAKSMDHIKLIRLAKHLSEDEAVDYFYELAGETRPIDSMSDYLRRVMNRLQANVHMDVAARFFADRGITFEVLQELGVGYSPSYDWFKQAIEDVPISEAARLELIQPHLFNNAIIYPQYDGLGRVAGFRSRPFVSSQKYYANAQGYPLKPSRLYGLHLVGSGQIVLVEGPNDVLGLRSKGIKNVAGLMGNKTRDIERYLTERGFSDITFLADGEEAGKEAILKAPPLVRVNQIPDGLDPDEYAHKFGLFGIVKLINEADFPFWLKVKSKLSTIPSDDRGKIMLIKSIASDISDGLPKIVLRKVKQRIAKVLEIEESDVDSIFELVQFDSSALEAKIISHLVLGGEFSEDIKIRSLPWMFGDPRYRKQYEDILKGINLSEYVTDKGLLTDGDIDRFLEISRRRRIKSIMNRAAGNIMNIAEPFDDLVSHTLSKLYDTSYRDIEIFSARQQLETGIRNAMERYNNQDRLLGISFGQYFPKTNETLQGLRPNTIYVLAASSGVGKSALALQWAMGMAYEQNIPVLWVSLEMSQLDISTRIVSKLSKVSAKRMMSGKLDSNEVLNLGTQYEGYMQKPLHMVNLNGTTISQLVALVRKMKTTHGIQAVFIDYIQLIRGNPALSNSYERVGAISEDIKQAICQDKHIGLPVVAVAQLNRQSVKSSLPGGEHMAESYKVVQDADVIITLKKRSPEEMLADKAKNQDFGNLLMNIDKNRSGEDKQLQGLIFDKSSLVIKEVGIP